MKAKFLIGRAVKMGSEARSNAYSAGVTITVGQRVKLEGSHTDFVVIDVDRSRGRVELLQVKPARIESNPPMAAVGKNRPHLVPREK